MDQTTLHHSNELRKYFIKQDQHLHELHKLVAHNIWWSKFKQVLNIILEIFIYLKFIGFVIAAAIIPSNPIQIQESINEQNSAQIIYHNDEITGIMWLLKFAIFSYACLSLVFAFVLRRHRRKAKILNKVALQVVQMKSDFNLIIEKETAK